MTSKPLQVGVHLHSVQREDDRNLGACITGLEGVLEMWHRQNRGHQGACINVSTAQSHCPEPRWVTYHRIRLCTRSRMRQRWRLENEVSYGVVRSWGAGRLH